MLWESTADGSFRAQVSLRRVLRKVSNLLPPRTERVLVTAVGSGREFLTPFLARLRPFMDVQFARASVLSDGFRSPIVNAQMTIDLPLEVLDYCLGSLFVSCKDFSIFYLNGPAGFPRAPREAPRRKARRGPRARRRRKALGSRKARRRRARRRRGRRRARRRCFRCSRMPFASSLVSRGDQYCLSRRLSSLFRTLLCEMIIFQNRGPRCTARCATPACDTRSKK